MAKKVTLDSLFDVKGKVVAVTGGAGTIGGEICEGLALMGMKAAVLDFDPDRAAAKAVELRGLTGGDLAGFGINITDLESARAAFAAVKEEFGALDGVVLSAGVTHEEYLRTMDMANWEKVVKVNAMGTAICCKAAGEVFDPDKGGRIVTISSLSASNGKPLFTAYTPSKCATDGFVWTLATEWGRRNITVNSLWPIVAPHSPMNFRKKDQPGFYETFIARKSEAIRHYPREMAGFIGYLFSGSADYVNGQVFDCTTGRHRSQFTAAFSAEDPKNPGHGMAERKVKG